MLIRADVYTPDGKGSEVAHLSAAHVMAVVAGLIVMANGKTYRLRYVDDEDGVVEALESYYQRESFDLAGEE